MYPLGKWGSAPSVSLYKSMVGKWAYVKELATTNTRGRGGIESIRLYAKGKHIEG